MKILQVITDTDRRGAQVFATDLGGALRARGHHVDTVALAPGTTVPALDVPTLGPTRLSATSLRALRARARDADVIAAHGSSTLPACALATVGLRTPFVYRQISESLFWAPNALRRWRVRAFLSRAKRVVSLSATQADVLVEHFGVARRRIDIVPNGVPQASFGPASPGDRGFARERFEIPRDAFVVLSISALVPEKGVDRVIDAVAGMAVADETASGAPWLLVAGEGPARRELEAHAATALGARTRFVGSVADPLPAYAAADVVVLASKGGDSMPATLVEAGFCAVPAIATPVGAITDVVLDGVTGVIVPRDARVPAFTAALQDLAGDADRRTAMGAAARAHCLEHFEIGVVARQWEAALEAAATARRRD
jgi:glycosyltransferase involved in cell wall biosynthesis